MNEPESATEYGAVPSMTERRRPSPGVAKRRLRRPGPRAGEGPAVARTSGENGGRGGKVDRPSLGSQHPVRKGRPRFRIHGGESVSDPAAKVDEPLRGR